MQPLAPPAGLSGAQVTASLRHPLAQLFEERDRWFLWSPVLVGAGVIVDFTLPFLKDTIKASDNYLGLSTGAVKVDTNPIVSRSSLYAYGDIMLKGKVGYTYDEINGRGQQLFADQPTEIEHIKGY